MAMQSLVHGVSPWSRAVAASCRVHPHVCTRPVSTLFSQRAGAATHGASAASCHRMSTHAASVTTTADVAATRSSGTGSSRARKAQMGSYRDPAELEANAMRVLLSSKGTDATKVFGHIMRNVTFRQLHARDAHRLGLVRRLWRAAQVAASKQRLVLGDAHYASYLAAHNMTGDTSTNLSVLEHELADAGVERSPVLLEALAKGYGLRGDVARVHEVNDEAIRLPNGGPLESYTMAVLEAHLVQRAYTEALNHALASPHLNPGNAALPLSHLRLLREFGREGVPHLAVRVVEDVKKNGHGMVEDDTYNHVAAAFIVHGDMEQAMETLRLRASLTTGRSHRQSRIAVDLERDLLQGCFTGDFGAVTATTAQFETLEVANLPGQEHPVRPMLSNLVALVHAFRVRGSSQPLVAMLSALDEAGATSYLGQERVLRACCEAFARCHDAPSAALLVQRAVTGHSAGKTDDESLACTVLQAILANVHANGASSADVDSAFETVTSLMSNLVAHETQALNAHGWQAPHDQFLRSQTYDDLHTVVASALTVRRVEPDGDDDGDRDTMFGSLQRSLANGRGRGSQQPFEQHATTSQVVLQGQLNAMRWDASHRNTHYPDELNNLLGTRNRDWSADTSAAAVDCLLTYNQGTAAMELLSAQQADSPWATNAVTAAPLARHFAETGELDKAVAVARAVASQGIQLTHAFVTPVFGACAREGNVREAVNLLDVVTSTHMPISGHVMELLYQTCLEAGDFVDSLAMLRLSTTPQCDRLGTQQYIDLLAAGFRTFQDADKLQQSIDVINAGTNLALDARAVQQAAAVAAVAADRAPVTLTLSPPSTSPTTTLQRTTGSDQATSHRSSLEHGQWHSEPGHDAGPARIDFNAAVASLVETVASHSDASERPDFVNMMNAARHNGTVELGPLCTVLTSVVGSSPLPPSVSRAVLVAHSAGARDLVMEDLDVFHRGLVDLDADTMMLLLPRLRRGANRTSTARRQAAEGLFELWFAKHSVEAHPDVSLEIFSYFNDSVQDVRRARDVYDALMASSNLSDTHAQQLVLSHLTLGIYKRNDQTVAELLDTAARRGFLDDAVLVDTLRRLLQQGRKSFNGFAEMLLPSIQHPRGESLSYNHKINLMRVYSSLAAASHDHGATQHVDAALATYNQISEDGQSPGIWAHIFRIQALVAVPNKHNMVEAEVFWNELRDGPETPSPQAQASCASSFVRGYASLLKFCPAADRPHVIQSLLHHVDELVASGIPPDRKTSSALIHGLASVAETKPACLGLYEKIDKQGDAGAALKEFIKVSLRHRGRNDSEQASACYNGIYEMMQLRADVDCDNVLFMLGHFVETNDHVNFRRFFELRRRMAKNNRNLYLHMAQAHLLHLKSIVGPNFQHNRRLGKERAEAAGRALVLLQEECGSAPSSMRSFVQDVQDAVRAEAATAS
eukprot:m.18878 g.18878  ORF g.18878 m.18878 type:complete len:1432 (+) comp3637_c0_seq1:82-4377(+)